MATELSRSTYLEKNVGDYPATVEIAGKLYEKVEDLRYGTNPHQPAAFYRPVNSNGAIGSMQILKTAKAVFPKPIWKIFPVPSISSNTAKFPAAP